MAVWLAKRQTLMRFHFGDSIIEGFAVLDERTELAVCLGGHVNGFELAHGSHAGEFEGVVLVGFSFDVAAQQRLTRSWWELAPTRLEIVVSQLVLDECGSGDPIADDYSGMSRTGREINDIKGRTSF